MYIQVENSKKGILLDSLINLFKKFKKYFKHFLLVVTDTEILSYIPFLPF